jgi:ABC-type transport system involved in multi-copper enzyme maturation permease subunit
MFRVNPTLMLLTAAVFGAGDQYLGSFSMHPWMADVSLLSAPWLVLAFLAGCTQREPKRAALLGFGCTFAALIGYGAMTLSPVENAHMNLPSIAAFLVSEAPVFVMGLVTGPLFGWFGQRWHMHRAWLGAAVTAAAFCLEPFARMLTGDSIRSSRVLVAEVAVGIAIASYIAVQRLTSRGTPV